MSDSRIRVIIRKRPINQKEIERGDEDVVEVEGRQVIFKEHRQRVDLTHYVEQHRFIFDAAYSQHTSNDEIYRQEVKPLLDHAFRGANVTCFAYGQTGSGKTFTMLGKKPFIKGVYASAATEVFRFVETAPEKLSVNVSFFEIYCNKLYDLLNERKELFAREDAHSSINIVGLRTERCSGVEHLFDIVEFGETNRITAKNNVNIADSSRSHAILELALKAKSRLLSKIIFIDLAGS